MITYFMRLLQQSNSISRPIAMGGKFQCVAGLPQNAYK